ncbi:EF-hand domain-containing protein [Aliiroseovarius lamellibrachiae]|uniref:EF-hand domain-containing protein n=1 Tax=Aliiroseovarius lamellibrachiae TaxID=1924933 RepID=UPI001BE0744B|nr:EF-hand domain-containing protein [Aliiroseovarius lamellibrachiae]MBT2130941.1 EF-hand domain-containing protein [Aliiroseovarius lamellibrachiae]
MKRATKIATIALMAGVAVTASGLTASAFGGKGGPMGGKGGRMGGIMQMEFADVDMDNSGLITADDLKAHAAAKFAEADANGDGALDLTEVKAQAEAHMKERMASAPDGQGGKRMGDGPSAEKRMGWMAEQMIEKRDADNSGTVSLAEMTPDQSKLDRMIDRFDTDDDNAISAAEFDAAQKEMWMRHAGKRHGKGGKHGG